jgi:hypothetical protein
MGHNNLYINGCSFTKGHRLPEEESWPFLLQKELNLSQKYKNNSQNGNSLSTIAKKSIIDLTNHSKNTLAVIGLTWPTRYSLLIDDCFYNLGPAFYEKNNTKKIGYNNLVRMDDNQFTYEEWLSHQSKFDLENGNNIINSFTKFVRDSIRYDNKFIRNQHFDSLLELVLMESFFKSNNIDYIFIEFMSSMGLSKYNEDYEFLFNINKDNLLPISLNVKRMIESHPSKEQCIEIKDEIIKKIKKLYPKYLKSNQLNLF